MVDNNYRKIKERMKMRSMELWGIENSQKVDPVIEMFLDVFSYELSKIYQEVKISDAKLLERISKILVNENWSLPTPSHALLSVQPSEQVGEIEKTTQLYFQKIVKGELNDVFFTPIKKQELLKAKVYCTAWERELAFDTDKGFKHVINSYKESQVPEYTIWVGIDIDESLLQEITKMPISILLKDSHLNPYLKMSKVQDYEGNDLILYQEQEDINTNKEHYYTTIQRYYQDYLYTIDLSNSTKKRHKLTNRCNGIFNQEEIEEYDKELFWLQISFSVAFTKEELDKITISTNTFPVVNRKRSYKQHSIKRNGKIVSLYFDEKEYFLNVESLIDNEGRMYKSALKNDINNMEGSFSLYFGDIEQFDERNAKSILTDVIQTVREEGSSFSAVGYDLLNAYLEDLNNKLDTLERKVNFRYKDVSDNSEKVYLQTIPHKTSNTYECIYWTTNAGLANDIKQGTLLNQYQTIELQADSIRLQTDTVGGIVKKGAKEKISSFRYGLLSKDRIVSNEDIKEFIYMTIGDVVKNVSVKSGVGISVHKKQGLVRTINVEVLLSQSGNLSNENKKRLGNYLQLELENKSVHSTPYRVNII
ncbi:type VI secretion system baseplate subunit TssF [Aquimarina muelleri]|uniref:Uncharacterized protein n=1 Tax=Aquimarina muelleri TaxID=279356 RepID=A0A918N4N2_9FLAO|nr:type VI secretion system baseplate subunit TssF [Aquimarina muelleri]MCX2764493.1 type VI secretion system baseplate subunit TssF [Aquimarina muelleri]GGX30712.1 hypothetical protein GCM10007384_34780 [Aquimarina muelleri]